MPTVLRVNGLRVVIYPNDHPPVHVIGSGWMVIIGLIGLELREAIGCSERDARRAMRLIAEHGDELMHAWRQFHG